MEHPERKNAVKREGPDVHGYGMMEGDLGTGYAAQEVASCVKEVLEQLAHNQWIVSRIHCYKHHGHRVRGTHTVHHAHGCVDYMAEFEEVVRDNSSADEIDIDCYLELMKRDMEGDGDDDDPVEQSGVLLVVGSPAGCVDCVAMAGKESDDCHMVVLYYSASLERAHVGDYSLNLLHIRLILFAQIFSLSEME